MKVTNEEIAQSAERCGGNLSEIARDLNVNRRTIARRRDADESGVIREAIEMAEAMTTDKAVRGLSRAIEAEKPWAIRYWLSTKGKDRGFTTKTEVETTAPQSRVVIQLPDNGRGDK